MCSYGCLFFFFRSYRKPQGYRTYFVNDFAFFWQNDLQKARQFAEELQAVNRKMRMVRKGVALITWDREIKSSMHCLLPSGSYIGEVFIGKGCCVFFSEISVVCWVVLWYTTTSLPWGSALHSSVTFSSKKKDLIEFFVKHTILHFRGKWPWC